MEPWWGKSTFDDDAPRCWRIDSTALWVQRLASEWRVAWETNGAAGGDGGAGASLLELPNVARFGVQDPERTLSLLPALADRPVVSRPEKPFSVPPDNTVMIFIGTPLWMQLRLGSGGAPLLDAPIVRPSDTWFGPNTRTGELCYASRTACRLSLEELPPHAHRAFTAVTLRNESSGYLALERLKVPVSYLGLYLASSGMLWTEHVELTHVSTDAVAPVRVNAGPPAIAGKTTRVGEPRRSPTGNVFERAFATLFC